MQIDQLVLKNFKSFKERFSVRLNSGVNIIVGDNEAGKSTIIEAVNLALTGLYNGRYLRNELSQYLFNASAVSEYIDSLITDEPLPPPEILIELYIGGGEEVAVLEGDLNSEGSYCSGISLKISFNEDYKTEYEALISGGDVKTLPIEYYHAVWKSFARETITTRSIPIKSALIDSTAARHQNGSDIYIGRIVKELLTPEEIISVSQSHRKMKEHFMDDVSIEAINQKITDASKVTDKEVKIAVELSSRNAWESGLTTYLDNIPFHFVGKQEHNGVRSLFLHTVINKLTHR